MSTTEQKRGRGRPKKDPKELRVIQLRALRALHRSKADSFGTGITLQKIALVAGVHANVIRLGMGTVDPGTRAAHDETQGFKSLLSRGMVRCEDNPDLGTVYYLTAFGHRAVEQNAERIAALGGKMDNGYRRVGTRVVRTRRTQ